MADSWQNPQQIKNLYPAGEHPESRFRVPQGLGQMPLTRLGVTGLLRSVIGCLFAEADMINDRALRQSLIDADVWRETKTSTHQDTRDANPETGILIESTYRWRLDRQQHTPAIWIHAHDWTWSRRGVGDRSGTDDLLGTQQYGGQWVGAHTVFTVSKDPAVAERLGFEVGYYLRQCAAEISKHYFSRFDVSRIGQVGQFEQVPNLFAVPIDLPYAVSYDWESQPEAPRLKRFRAVIGS